MVTTDPYPNDIDTQSIANTIIKPVDETAHAVLDEILACENEDGIIPVSQAVLSVHIYTLTDINSFTLNPHVHESA